MNFTDFVPCSRSTNQVISIIPENGKIVQSNRRNIHVAKVNAKGGIVIDDILECPLADLTTQPLKINRCPFHAHKRSHFFHLKKDIPLDIILGAKLCENDSVPNSETAELLRNIGGGDRIREICTRFYARAFIDYQLSPFFFNFDGTTKHAKRLADWIVEHMGGEGTPWLDTGRWESREPSHREAWHSTRREASKQGTPFKLDDTRVWMRLHFWSVRECGLGSHACFMSWYIKFIGYFVQIYEVKAGAYAQSDAEWSSNHKNIESYIKDGNKMTDVIGIF